MANFRPTRPIEDIAQEYIQCFWEIYEPSRYLARVYRHFVTMESQVLARERKFQLPPWMELRAALIILWRQGIKRSTRWQFWRQLFSIQRRNPGVLVHYLSTCATLEHFLEYRPIVRDSINAQLAEHLAIAAESEAQPLSTKEPTPA